MEETSTHKKSPGACAPGLCGQHARRLAMGIERKSAVRDQQSRNPSKKNWAHQDSNLERAGYEPAALTVELWARSIVTKSACGRCQATECSPALARPPSNSARGWGPAPIKKCWLAAFSQHSSVRMGPHP